MKRTMKGMAVVALGAVTATGLAACSSSSSNTPATSGAKAAEATKGGTLNMVVKGPQEHWDPQRMYIGADIEFASRTFVRTLTTFSPGTNSKLIPDLATDLGQSSDGGKVWKFTLADGGTWQDGSPITCEDIKYGISRTFAQDTITGGPNYILNFLDVPTKKDEKGNDAPAYNGPYKKEGQDLYDKAVTCNGKEITFKFKTPWTDFNMAATYPAYAPFKASQDKGAASDFAIFSSGPYKLQGTFDPDKGGTFVRNENWKSDKDPFRKAYPDKIVYTIGVEPEVIYQRLIANGSEDQTLITNHSAPPAALAQIAGNASVKDRMVNPAAPYVDYIQPNMRSAVFKNDKVRQAFAMATNRDAYVTAYGGPTVMTPTYAMCNKELKCFKDFNPFGAPTSGDTEGAKKLLADAGVTTPVNVTVVYRKRGASDKALLALKETWDKGGFNVTLEGISEKYYATIQGPAMANKDAFWAGWGADWPSGSTVIPALFDSRVNISAGGSGQDYGYFDDADVNKKIDEAYLIADENAREKAWGEIDEMIAKKAAVVPLVNQKFVFLYGSKVKNFETNNLMGGYVDLANIAVAQ